MKKRNPSFGYGRISMQIFNAFGTTISRFTVGRILRKNKDRPPSGDGPSWLTFIGHMKDSLWSVDLHNKLERFQTYYNDGRAHSSLDTKTPKAMAYDEEPDKNVISIDHYQWEKQCSGLYELPVAA